MKLVFWTDAQKANGMGGGRTFGGGLMIKNVKVIEVPHPNTLCLVHMQTKTAVLRVGEAFTEGYWRPLIYVFCFYEEGP